MSIVIQQAMILAAGYGKRLGSLTDTIPKPLLPINGTTCLDKTIHRLKRAGVKKFVVNTHHLAPQVHKHLTAYPGTFISYEPEILNTGGGIAKALHYFGEDPFYCINGDVWWWEREKEIALKEMNKTWDESEMDILLMVVPKDQAIGYSGLGDYYIDQDQCLCHRRNNEEEGYIYSGIQIVSPSAFYKSKFWPSQSSFPLINIFNETEQRKRLKGYIHSDLWADIGSTRGLEETRKQLETFSILK